MCTAGFAYAFTRCCAACPCPPGPLIWPGAAPLPLQLRVFVDAPDAMLSSSSKDSSASSSSSGSGGGTTAVSRPYKHELNQSPLLFRESAASPDQEEKIRRKDAIIQTRNAQVAALWDELHTRQPWRNAVGSGKPVQPFPDEAEAEAGARAAAGNDTGLLLYVGINTVSGWALLH